MIAIHFGDLNTKLESDKSVCCMDIIVMLSVRNLFKKFITWLINYLNLDG